MKNVLDEALAQQFNAVLNRAGSKTLPSKAVEKYASDTMQHCMTIIQALFNSEQIAANFLLERAMKSLKAHSIGLHVSAAPQQDMSYSQDVQDLQDSMSSLIEMSCYVNKLAQKECESIVHVSKNTARILEQGPSVASKQQLAAQPAHTQMEAAADMGVDEAASTFSRQSLCEMLQGLTKWTRVLAEDAVLLTTWRQEDSAKQTARKKSLV
jgi:hypothetical protein